MTNDGVPAGAARPPRPTPKRIGTRGYAYLAPKFFNRKQIQGSTHCLPCFQSGPALNPPPSTPTLHLELRLQRSLHDLPATVLRPARGQPSLSDCEQASGMQGQAEAVSAGSHESARPRRRSRRCRRLRRECCCRLRSWTLDWISSLSCNRHSPRADNGGPGLWSASVRTRVTELVCCPLLPTARRDLRCLPSTAMTGPPFFLSPLPRPALRPAAPRPWLPA